MIKNIEAWLLSHYGQEVYTPGLSRINLALSLFKEQIKSRIVIIAGTNGKGETTHRLGQYFKDSSFCSWTSPHITNLTERFSSEEGDIPSMELEEIISQSHQLVKENNFQLTYYEFLFFCFCFWATKKKPLYLFLEVGLGGRLDAVNCLNGELVLLSSISRDHQEFLGNRYDLILNEKLGVLRPNAKLISFLDLQYLRDRLPKSANHVDLNQFIKLPGFAFSERNQFLAYAASCHLKNIPFDISNWMANPVGLPSRGELIRAKNHWWLFGSHNLDGMRKLIQFLVSSNYNCKDKVFDAVVTSFSRRNEKDIRVMLRMLKGCRLGEVVVTSFDHPKAFAKKDLERIARQEGLKFVENIAGEIAEWKNQKVLVAGSYYFLGKLKPLLS